MVGNINKYQYHYEYQQKLNDTNHLLVVAYIRKSGPVGKLAIQELDGKDLIPRSQMLWKLKQYQVTT
jgi:hypothetical protein